MSLVNTINNQRSYLMSVGVQDTPYGQTPVSIKANRGEVISKTGDKQIDDISSLVEDFKGDLSNYYSSDFYKEFKIASNQLGYGSIKKFEKIEVSKLKRDAAAYVDPKSKRIGVSDKKNQNFKSMANDMDIGLLSAIYLSFSHEHYHADVQSNAEFKKGMLYTELDVEARLYASLVQMAQNNDSKANEYTKMANGVAKRYETLNKMYTKKTGKDSGLAQKYMAKVKTSKKNS